MSDELQFVDIKVYKRGLVYIEEVPARIRPGVSGWIRFGKRSRRARWKDRRAQRAVGRMPAYAKHVRKGKK